MPAGDENRIPVLIKFSHGLGDAVQATVVLKHLAAAHPDWAVDVWSLRGKHSAFHGLCRRSYHDQESRPPESTYARVFDLGWYENYNRYGNRPNSKITNCLAEVFGVPYDPALGRYEIRPTAEAVAAAESYLRSLGLRAGLGGRYPVALFHYQGNTSGEKKNLPHEDVAVAVGAALEAGLTPIVLDWDHRSPLPDGQRVFCPRVGPDDPWGGFGSGDCGVLAALIARSSIFVGIDSGPGKCASATDTPTVIAWTGHHPMQFHDPAANTLHLIPTRHRELPPMENSAVARYFEEHYRYACYGPRELASRLAGEVWQVAGQKACEAGPGLSWLAGFQVPARRPEQSWVIINDVYLNDGYKTHLRPPRSGAEYVLDVGANVGCFAALWHRRNPSAQIACIEVQPKLCEALRANVGDYARIFHAACHYDTDDLLLLDSIEGDGFSTGGSRVVHRAEWEAVTDPQYLKLDTPLERMTVEGVMEVMGWDRLHVLKLDCEGSEYSILDNFDLSLVHTLFVESHGSARWRELLARRFAGWDVGHMSRSPCGEFEVWHLVSPTFDSRFTD
jgi:FkbM family methyltransferase